MAANYSSTRETANFARLSRLIVDICSDLLRKVLNAKLPPPGLTAILQSQRVHLLQILDPRQRDIVYPPGQVFAGTLDDLDFTLLYKLIRNIQGINIPPPQNGWGNTPGNEDRSLSANIDRLREQRNEAFAHLPKASLSDAEFEDRWNIIRQSVSEIETVTLTGATFKTAVDTLRNDNMDPDTENAYIQELLKQRIKAMEATTSDRIKREEKKKDFISTKAFCDAKEKLKKNRTVVIKGNIGDGKTATAIQLLHWLSNEHQDRQPLQIHKIEDLDLLHPGSKHVVFIDDIFGERVLREREVGEWNKRIGSVNEIFRRDDQSQANFLVVTVRNEVFRSLRQQSLGTTFIGLNVIDLSSNTYKISKEKMDLLELFEPKVDTFTSWTEKEKEQILASAPDIGFPQCCCLFRDIPELQKERVNFFEKPLHFFNEVLPRLEGCYALLFLFLSGGKIQATDLDPNSQKVNKKLLEEAFEIDLSGGADVRTSSTYEKKIQSVKKSLDMLAGGLVVKEKEWGSDDDVYRFNHDSVYVAVALNYGKVTPIGYIQNCPSKSLSYLTTSKTATNMIVISRRRYTYMCERLVREFEIKGYDYGATIASLDVWKDGEFLGDFFRLLNDKNTDKLTVLNKACSYGAKECALHLLLKGVKPDKDTPDRIVNGNCVEVLEWIVIYLSEERKLALLGKACATGSLECAIYLLSKGVKPDKHVDKLWDLMCIERFKGELERLMRVFEYLSNETKLDMLNKACSNGTEECALYLLSKGVLPDENTPFCVVERGSVTVLRKLFQYDVTSTARDDDNNNVLHHSCLYEREEMVTILCERYPHLVHDSVGSGRTPLLTAALKGNCCVFKTVEKFLLTSLCRVEDHQHKCESVDDHVVHRSCACAQYMSQNVDDAGCTVLHLSYRSGHKKLCSYLSESYPALTTTVDKGGRHCLHYIAEYKSDVNMFTECETKVKQYLESTGHKYDITAILDGRGESVLDKAEKRKQGQARHASNPLYEHLIKVFDK